MKKQLQVSIVSLLSFGLIFGTSHFSILEGLKTYQCETIIANSNLTSDHESVKNVASIDSYLTTRNSDSYGTNIAARDTYINTIVVDEWKNYVTVDGKINAGKLAEFLVLTDVLSNTVFTIINEVVDYKSGVLTFKIRTNITVDSNGSVQNTPSVFFPITLNLIPRVTTIKPKISSYIAKHEAEFMGLFNIDPYGMITDKNSLSTYINITAPVANANYYVIPESKVYNSGTGRLIFNIYTNKFYDSEGIERVGDKNIAAAVFTMSFYINCLISEIHIKADYPKTTMVNDWIKTLDINPFRDDAVINLGELEKYFDFKNFQNNVYFKIKNVNYGDYDQFIRNQISFNIISSESNWTNDPRDVQLSKRWGTFTLTLGDQHAATDILSFADGNYPRDITPNRFLELILKDGATAEDDKTYILTANNIPFLKNYFSLNSLAPETVLKLIIVESDNVSGKLSMQIIPDRCYNENGLIVQNTVAYDIDLELARADAIPPPTSIWTQPDELPTIDSRESFENLIYADGVINTTELSKFVDGLNTIPPEAEVLSVAHVQTIVDIMTYRITIFGYYDGHSLSMQQAETAFNFDVQIKEPFVQQTQQTPEVFEWWWILVGIGGATIAAALTWLFITHRHEILRKVNLRGSGRRPYGRSHGGLRRRRRW